ncbi:MAG: glycosyltransferase family 2 protein [Pseudomonadota bacterium]
MEQYPPEFSIVVPCFDEEQAIEDTVQFLCEKIETSMAYEVIVVDDGSRDRTPALLSQVSSRFSSVKVVTHQNNRGYGAAIKTGIRQAAADIIVITDADGTYPNEKIPQLVEKCEDQDMVVGARIGTNVVRSGMRAIPKSFLKFWVSWLSRQPVPDVNSGLRAFKKERAQEHLNILPDGFSLTTTITLAMLTNNRSVEFSPIDYQPRIGNSKIQPVHDTLRFILLVLRTGVYFAPVRAFAPLLIVMAIASVISFLYDTFVLQNLTDKTLLLALFTLNTGMFVLLADMIDKRSAK